MANFLDDNRLWFLYNLKIESSPADLNNAIIKL